LLLPAGVTSTASIEFKDEAEILAAAPPGQDAYLTQVLPAKMRLNLRDVQNFSIGRDLSIALRTGRPGGGGGRRQKGSPWEPGAVSIQLKTTGSAGTNSGL